MVNTADFILNNGEIYSVNAEGNLTVSESLAVKDGKILFVGSSKNAETYKSDRTEVQDLEGKTVLPGLCDSHLHASATAEMIFSFDMTPVIYVPGDSRDILIEKYLELIRKETAGKENEGWIRGTGWNPAVFMEFPDGQPTAKDLDRVCPDKPMVLRSFDHHFLWVNSLALELSGITRATPNPRNGVIERDKEGTPTGIFQETSAVDLFLNNAEGSDYSVEEYKEGLRLYQKSFANNYGTTLVFDAMATKNAMQAYREMAKDGEFTIRVKGSVCADPSLPATQFDKMIRNKKKDNVEDCYEVDTIKFFIDGSGFSFFMAEPFEKAALEHTPFPDDYRGYPQWELEELKSAFLKLNEAGFQIHCHCMGDGAVSLALDAFEFAAESKNISDNRNVITHIMNIQDRDYERMARLNVIAAMQPMWTIYDSFMDNLSIPLVGAKRALNSYPTGRLKKAGIRVSAGTDFPVVIPPNPFIGIQTGITRSVPESHPEYRAFSGKVMGHPDHPTIDFMSLKDMVESYTISGAYQSFLENTTGSLEAGKSADLVILDRKMTTTEVKDLEKIKVERTYFKGELVYEKKY